MASKYRSHDPFVDSLRATRSSLAAYLQCNSMLLGVLGVMRTTHPSNRHQGNLTSLPSRQYRPRLPWRDASATAAAILRHCQTADPPVEMAGSRGLSRPPVWRAGRRQLAVLVILACCTQCQHSPGKLTGKQGIAFAMIC